MDDATPPDAPLDWFHLVSHACGGVCLLNYSLASISRALRTAFGPRLREAIRHATHTRARAFATGVAVTALLSSATASTLLVLAFVEAGDMTLQQSLGIGLGVGLGSTLNAHLIAFSLHRYAMAMIAGGYTVHSWSGGGGAGAPRHRAVASALGEAVFGLGLMFAATAAISAGLAPLKSYPPVVEFLAGMHNPATALAVSAAAAVAFQSSNTVIAIVIMLAQAGFLSCEGCCTLVLGANVGTSVTPVLAALGKRREALRVAVAFLAMRAAAVALLLPLLPRFVAAVQWATAGAQARAMAAAVASVARDAGGGGGGASRAQQLAALARAAVMPSQVAMAHTLANAWIALACLPVLGLVAPAVSAWLPGEVGGAGGDGGGGGGGGGGEQQLLLHGSSAAEGGGALGAAPAAAAVTSSKHTASGSSYGATASASTHLHHHPAGHGGGESGLALHARRR